MLLHELVHAAQFDVRDWDCPQSAEWQADARQAAWLAEQRIDTGFGWTAILIRSICPNDVHP